MSIENDHVVVVKLCVPPTPDRLVELKCPDTFPFTRFKRVHLGDGKYGMRPIGHDLHRAALNGHQPLPQQQQKQEAASGENNPSLHGPFRFEDYAPPSPPDPSHAIIDALKKTGLNGSAFRQLKLKPRARLLDDWFREGDSGFIYSRRGVGKTWLSWMIARGIAMGVSVGPWSAGDQAVKVYYLDGEMPAELMQQREIAFGDASDNLILINHEVLFERTGLVLNLRLPEVQRAITEWCIEGAGKVLFIDNLSTLVSGVKENESDAWELLLPWLLELRRKKIAVVLVHHAGRSGEMRGTSRREDSVFWIIKLEENTNYSGKGCSFVQRFDKNRNSSSNHASYNWTFKPREDYDQRIDVSFEIASLESQVFDLIVDGLVTCRAIAEELKTSTASVSRTAKKLASEGKITVNKRRYRPIDEGG